MMRVRPLIPLGLLAMFVLAAPSSTSADPIYLTVDRVVSIFNVANPRMIQDFGLGAFDAEVATGAARGTQSSTIGPAGIVGFGTAEAQPIGIPNPAAQTSLSATFMLTTAHRYVLDAMIFHLGEDADSVPRLSVPT